MGFFEDAFAAAGRRIDTLIDHARSLAPVSSLAESRAADWSAGAVRETVRWFSGDEAATRRIVAGSIAAAVSLAIAVTAVRAATRTEPTAVVTEAHRAAADRAKRNMEVQRDRVRSAKAASAKPQTRPTSPPRPRPRG